MSERGDKGGTRDIDDILGQAGDQECKRGLRDRAIGAILSTTIPILCVGTTVAIVGIALTLRTVGAGLDVYYGIKNRKRWTRK
jgi:hypothetical protein